ncbi:hypothetical protein ACH3XW_38565 [Acanthocheilonema viteae]|uniref:Uncharacterized protein n=1 Tax=Acanthocheilonema viteae TaxID=6277 RepID=A0A498SL89_ACAVI|nr:unnamed protein product [Acanthocheilonema viteae]
MILLVVFFIAISSSVVWSENEACEQLIKCYAKSREKTDECLSHTEKRECRNDSLQLELKELIDERSSLYENCLREKSSTATTIGNAKKKAKCDAILQRNPFRRSKLGSTKKDKNKRKNRRSIHKNKKNNTQQKLCFREARKLKTYCAQLSKCCTISKLCKVSTMIEKKIATKRMEIKEFDEQCRLEHHGSMKAKNNKNDKRRGNYHGGGGEQRRKSKNQDSDI